MDYCNIIAINRAVTLQCFSFECVEVFLTSDTIGVSCRALFENRPALYFCKYKKKKKKKNTRILDTLFIDDFTDIMEQYFHY